MNNVIKSIVIILILLIIGFAYYLYKSNTYVSAEFKRLRPFQNGAIIYLNGFKIGKVVKVSPNKDYTSSVIIMKFYPKNLKLPINIEVNLKKKKNFFGKPVDFIDIIYPKTPSIYYLENGDKIAGKITVDLDYFLSNQKPEDLEQILRDVSSVLKDMNILVNNFNDTFLYIKSDIIQTSKNVNATSKQFLQTSENMKNVSENVDENFNDEKLTQLSNSTLSATNNLVDTTDNINTIVSQLNCSLYELNKVLHNVEGITKYLDSSFSQPLGGIKFLLGKKDK